MKSHTDHNKLLGPGLLIWAVDHLRAMHQQAKEVTLWSLNRSLCEEQHLKGRDRDRQYTRMKTVVRSLEASGHITCAMRWDTEQEKHHKVITLCSE